MAPYRESRRWILIPVVLVLLVGAGLGAYFVIQRGLRKEGLYERAVRALDDERVGEAERLFRELLASDPDNTAARVRLIQLLAGDGRVREAEAELETWLEDPETPPAARRMYCEMAFRRWDLDAAAARARGMLEEDPEFAYGALIRVHEARGTFADLRESIRLALQLAEVSDKPSTKASARLYAAETQFDLLPAVGEAAAEAAERQARAWIARALELVDAASDERGFRRDVVLARIQVLSDEEEKRALGEEVLRNALEREPDDHGTRSALAKHLIRQERYEEALPLARELAEGPYNFWRGVLLSLALRDRTEECLVLLGDPPVPEDPMVRLMRARLLLESGDEARRAEGVGILTALPESPAFDVRLAARAFALLSEAGEAEAARAVLEAVPEGGEDPRLEALLLSAEIAGAAGEPAPDAAGRTAELAAQADDFQRSLQILGILQPAGRQAVEGFLDAQIEKGHEEARHRLLRAALHAQQAARAPESPQERRSAAASDLDALAGLDASRATLAAGARVALLAGLPERGGRLYGEALIREPIVDNLAAEILRRAVLTDDADLRAQVASGLRTAAEGSEQAAFLQAVAAAVEAGREGVEPLAETLRALAEDPASGPLARVTLLQLAGAGFDPGAPAVEIARAIVEARPEDQGARLLLGELLRGRRAWEDIRAFWEGRVDDHPVAREQWALALWYTGAEEAAVEAARAFRDDNPDDARAAVSLARLYALDGRLSEALAVLGAAPPNLSGLVLKAEVLRQRALEKQEDPLQTAGQRRRAWQEARQAWDRLIEIDPLNGGFWTALIELYQAQDKTDEALNRLTDRIRELEEATSIRERQQRAELLLRRAMLQEGSGRVDAALLDYVAVIEVAPTEYVSRNNAAWIIQDEYPDRIDEAVRYIEEALAVQPENPSLHDTAAMVHLRAGNPEQALEHATRAVAGSRRPGTMRTRAHVLEAAGREDDARAQWREIVAEFPDSEQAAEARGKLGES